MNRNDDGSDGEQGEAKVLLVFCRLCGCPLYDSFFMVRHDMWHQDMELRLQILEEPHD